MSELETILKEIEEQCKTGNRRALTTALRRMMQNRRAFFYESHASNRLDAYTDALYKILLLELDHEEEESIEIAELAYIGICILLKQDHPLWREQYKRRILLLHYFSDYFTDAVIEVFLKKYRQDNLLQARNLALECIEKMQLTDLFYIEENEPDFINGDEQLTDACNNISIDANLSPREREEAELLHKVMFAYLKAKYKN